MARVGDKRPHFSLALLARFQRCGDVTEHPVQRCAHLTDLGARVSILIGNPHRESNLTAVQRQL